MLSGADSGTKHQYLDTEIMNAGNSFLCFMAGAMAGAVAALLLAPDSGENTRTKIRQSASDMAGKAKGKLVKGLEIIEDALEEE